MELQNLRGEIDDIDTQLVRLFAARMDVSARIAAYKKEHALPIFVPSREEEKLREVAELAGPELGGYTRELYATIFALSRSYQSRQNEEASPLFEKQPETFSQNQVGCDYEVVE